MYEVMETEITIKVPSVVEMDSLAKNITQLVNELEETISNPEKEEKLITDVWVGIVLSLLVLSCSACICSCLLYQRFQLWKRREMEARSRAEMGNVENGERESLPSYSIVSGLPTYEEALNQLKSAKSSTSTGTEVPQVPLPPSTPTTTTTLAKLSVAELLTLYRQPSQLSSTSDTTKS